MTVPRTGGRCLHAGDAGWRGRRRLAQRGRARHAPRMDLNRILVMLGAALLIAVLTLFVSRLFGFTFLFLPLFFVGGSKTGR